METERKESGETVRTFAAASFLNDLGSDIIYPVWPLFVTTVLGGNMAVLGLLDGLGDALVSISQAVSGYLSDRIKRRKIFVWTGYLMGSVSRVGYAFSSVWQNLVPFRVMDRAGKIRGAPRDAMIADVSTDKNRGRNFGFLRAADNLGAVCGILLCIMLFERIGLRTLFLFAAVPSTISALLIIFMVKEPKAASGIYRGISLKDIDGNFRLLLLLNAFFALGAFSYSFLLIFAEKSGFRVCFIPVLYLVFTAVAFAVSIPFGRLSDITGRKVLLMLAFILWGLVCLSCIFLHAHRAVILAFILYGAHKGAMEPVQRAFVSELAPERFRASSLGLFQMVTGLCALPASLAAGLLWDRAGQSVPFLVSLLLTAVAAVMLVFVKEKRIERQNQSSSQ